MNKKVFTLVLITAILFGGLANAQEKSFNQGVEKDKKEFKVTASEKSPNASTVSSTGTKDQWDLLYSFDATEAGQQAVATDGNFIYTTNWGGDGTFHKYEMDGTFVSDFTITGAVGIRDFAYDGTYFYGSAASMNLFQMDFTTETLVSTITATCTGVTGIRHCTYDPMLDGGNGGFWIGNWGELGAIKMDGTEAVANVTGNADCYGSAYDNWSDPANPKVLLFTQGGSGVEIKSFDITTATFEGLVHDAADLPGYISGSSISGGMETYEADGLFILLGNVQQDPNLIFAYELATTTAATAPGACVDFTVTPAGLGVLTYDVSWTNPSLDFEGNALAEITAVALYVDGVEVTGQTWNLGISDANSASGLDITGGNHTVSVRAINTAGNGSLVSQTLWFGEDVPAAPTDVVLSATDMDASLVWVAPTVGQNAGYFTGTGLTYDVVRYPGAVLVSDDQTELTFSETLATAGNYTYEVIASNAAGEGDSEMSNTVLIGEFLLYEDFETWPLTDWSYATVGAGWVETDIQVHSGTKSVYHNDDDVANADWLISPAVNLVESGDLTFWEYQNYGSYYELHKVVVLDGPDPATAAELGVLYSEVGVEDTWTEKTFSLDLYAGQTVYFGFYYEGTYADEWFLDDITVVGREPLATYDVTFNIADGDAVNLNAEVTLYSGATEMFNGVAVDGTITFADVPEGDYTYDVELVGYFSQTDVALTVDGVETVDVVLVLDLTSVSDIIDVNNIAYPNPSNGLFTVAVDGQYEAKIYDVTGKMVHSSTLSSSNNTIDLSAQDAGVYFIQLNGENTINFRVIKN